MCLGVRQIKAGRMNYNYISIHLLISFPTGVEQHGMYDIEKETKITFDNAVSTGL